MANSVRDRMAADFEDRYDQLLAMLDDALKAEIVVRLTEPCKARYCNCKHHRTVKAPDYKTKLEIAKFFADQGFGRPAQAQAESESVNFTYKVVFEEPVA